MSYPLKKINISQLDIISQIATSILSINALVLLDNIQGKSLINSSCPRLLRIVNNRYIHLFNDYFKIFNSK